MKKTKAYWMSLALAGCGREPMPQLTYEPPEISAGGAAELLRQKGEMPDSIHWQPPWAQLGIGMRHDNVDFLDNAIQAGIVAVPPDPIGVAGIDSLLAIVNVTIRLSTKPGVAVDTKSLAAFFTTLTPANNLFDPKVIWDPQNQRYLVVALELVSSGTNPAAGNTSRIMLAVSKTSTPTSLATTEWNFQAIDSKLNTGGIDYWADYPGFETDEQAIYVAASMFRFPGSSGSSLHRLWIIDKGLGTGGLYDGGTSAVSVNNPIGSTGGFVMTMMPAQVFGAGIPGGSGNVGTYLAGYSSLSGGGIEFAQLIRIDDPLGTPAFTMHQVSMGDIDNTGAGMPDAPQLDGATAVCTTGGQNGQLIETADRRVQDALWRDDSLYITTTVVPGSGADSGQATARWVRFSTTSIPGAPTLQDGGNIGGEDIGAGTYTFYPSVAVNGAGEMKVGFGASGPTIYPGAYVAGRKSTDTAGTVGTSFVVKAGVDNYERFLSAAELRNRWGDYSGISTDPTDELVFWVFNMWANTQALAAGVCGQGYWSTEWATCTLVTEVEMSDAKAAQSAEGVRVTWHASREIDNLGFHVWRRDARGAVRLTPDLIPGAMFAGESSMEVGHSYGWLDADPRVDSRYSIETVNIHGSSEMVEVPAPVGLQPGESFHPSPTLAQLSRDDRPRVTRDRSVRLTPASEHARSVGRMLAARGAYKLEVEETGWYRVGFEDFASDRVASQNWALYADGREVRMVVDDADGIWGPGDSLSFYGVANDSASTGRRTYWLTEEKNPGRRATEGPQPRSVGELHTSEASLELREERLYFAGMKNGLGSNFFGPAIAATPVERSFEVTASAGGPASLAVGLQGVSKVLHLSEVFVNDVRVGEIRFSGIELQRTELPIPAGVLKDAMNVVKIVRTGGTADVALLEGMLLRYPRQARALEGFVRFQAPAGKLVAIPGFSESDAVTVVDVTEGEVERVLPAVRSERGLTVEVPGTGMREIVAVARPLRAKTSKDVASQYGEQEGADVIYLAHASMLDQASRLAELREKQGWKTVVIDVQDVFDEFGFGAHGPEPIARFTKHAASHWRHKPSALVLLGTASLDPRNNLGFGELDLVPSMPVDMLKTQTEAASDDALVDFDGDGLADLLVGRLPARTPEEARVMVDKILRFEEAGRTLESALLVAGSGSDHAFDATAQELRSRLPDGARAVEVDPVALGDVKAKERLVGALEGGVDVFAYVGHGGLDRLSGDLLTNDSVAEIAMGRSPVFLLFNCLSGLFNDPAVPSLAQATLASPTGAVAVWASSASTTPKLQGTLASGFFDQLSGGSVTLGEAIQAAKREVGPDDVSRSWNLLGDPLLKFGR